MSTVTSATQSAGTGIATDPASVRTPKKTLGQEDFLKLLSLQFQSQDPLKPMDDTSFLAQMAQFTSLQQMSSLTTEIDQMRSDQQKLASTAYLGRTVTMDAGNGKTATGTVDAVDTSGATPLLQVGGAFYALSALLSVAGTPSGANPPAA